MKTGKEQSCGRLLAYIVAYLMYKLDVKGQSTSTEGQFGFNVPLSFSPLESFK